MCGFGGGLVSLLPFQFNLSFELILLLLLHFQLILNRMEIDVIEAVVVLFRADRYVRSHILFLFFSPFFFWFKACCQITTLPMRPACVSTPKRPLRCAQLLILQSVELVIHQNQ